MSKLNSLHSYKILVTGAYGFLGRRLVEVLLDKGAFVVGVDTNGPSPDYFSGIFQHASFRFIKGDFQNKTGEILSKLRIKEGGEIAVFHMAGLVNIEECRKYPAKAFEANVSLTFQVLEFCKNNGVKKFVFPSTGLVYGDHLKQPTTEENATFPKNIYVATKLSAEAGVQGYAQSFGLTCVIARLGNVYGPKSRPDTVVGTIIHQIRQGKKIVVRDPSALRDFIYVDDAIEGLVRLLISADGPGYHIVNLSTGVGSSVRKVLETACRIRSIPIDRIQSGKGLKHASKLILNNDLLIKMTRWKPEYTLSEGLSLSLKDDQCHVRQ